MTKAEIILIATIVIFSSGVVFSVHSCNKKYIKAGSFRQIIIDTGKEIKSIKEEIARE